MFLCWIIGSNPNTYFYIYYFFSSDVCKETHFHLQIKTLLESCIHVQWHKQEKITFLIRENHELMSDVQPPQRTSERYEIIINNSKLMSVEGNKTGMKAYLNV